MSESSLFGGHKAVPLIRLLPKRASTSRCCPVILYDEYTYTLFLISFRYAYCDGPIVPFERLGANPRAKSEAVSFYPGTAYFVLRRIFTNQRPESLES